MADQAFEALAPSLISPKGKRFKAVPHGAAFFLDITQKSRFLGYVVGI
jgi:hypothetical protein